MPLALQVLPATILLIGMLLADESPRYLAQQRPTAALHVLAQLRGLPAAHPYVAREMASINAQLDEERALSSSDTSRLALLKEAFAVKSYRRRSVLCVSLMMWSNLTGTNAMTYYSPAIFASVGLLATGVYGIVKVVACGVFVVFVTDTLGRRRSLIWTGVAQVSAGGSFWGVFFWDQPADRGRGWRCATWGSTPASRRRLLGRRSRRLDTSPSWLFTSLRPSTSSAGGPSSGRIAL